MTNEKQYWDGTKNRIVRWYFYQQRGLALLNELRYLMFGIFGLYVLMKLDNPIWLFIMFIVSCPILVFVGWLQVNHMAAIINWLDVQYGSYWTKRSMEWQERQIMAIEEINSKIPDYNKDDS